MDNKTQTTGNGRSASLLRNILGIIIVAALFFAAGYAFGRLHGTEPTAPEPVPAPLVLGKPSASPESPASPDSPDTPDAPDAPGEPDTPETPEPSTPEPIPEPMAVREIVFYPAQTGVDEDDVYVYGEPIGVLPSTTVEEDGSYTSMDEVALYIHLYGHVPPNFVSKTKARRAGWVAERGNLQDVLPGMSIGGGGWHNDERVMPGSPDDQWYECDIDYEGGYRNAQRLVYSDNGMIFYTNDHYESYARIF